MNKYLIITALALLTLQQIFAQDEPWREEMKYLKYSPRYFGPNAFPLPELHNGLLCSEIEAEIRGDYHHYSGDRTKDVYARVFIPVAGGLAGVEVGGVIYEYYNMSEETHLERHSAGTRWPQGAHGDIIVSSYYQLIRNNKWADVMLEATLKTASGNRLADARFTDAASYWFDVNAGRNLLNTNNLTLKLQALAGFYCWMTNDVMHRQNDALVGSVGISGSVGGNIRFAADIVSLYGYENNGDRPIQLRTRLEYEYRRNALSFRYKHGIKDSLYDSFSLGYIRFF
ncbi:MAG: hypothetical protein LBR18_02950 [Tannerella sp.]|jgi:hypothetical protein|nr:hypothetical protein [Tannerella sp.]